MEVILMGGGSMTETISCMTGVAMPCLRASGMTLMR